MARDRNDDDHALAVLTADLQGAAVMPGGSAPKSRSDGARAQDDADSTAFDARPAPPPRRLQRRAVYRVRGAGPRTLRVEFRHPALPEMQLALRVLDLGVDGCALLLPPDVPAIAPGITINGARIRIGDELPLGISLQVQHLTSIQPGAPGARLGCRFAGQVYSYLI